MNERIRELINECSSFKEGDTEGLHDIEVFDKEKFAELIVRECAEVGSKFSQAHPEDIRFQIKKHFGVEE